MEVPYSDAEVVWVEVSLRNNHKLYVGSYYWPSSGNVNDQLNELEKFLQYITSRTRNNLNHTVMLEGDFNLGDIGPVRVGTFAT